LRPLDGIEHRDALLNVDGSEAEWPEADVIVGNPPFLGGRKKSGKLGRDYFNALNTVYGEDVPGFADLVCYWFHKARQQIHADKLQAAGLVATNSIRNGASRVVLDAIVADTHIFEAWSDEPWVNEGAAVRVSLIGFGKSMNSCLLDGHEVAAIHADLTTGEGVDLTEAKPLKENENCGFQGPEKNGAFDIDGGLARYWLALPNPNMRPNSDIVKPRYNGLDLVRRYSDGWVIDYGTSTTEAQAAFYELPFKHVVECVKPERDKNKDKNRKIYWWRFGRTGEDLRNALAGLPRYIATAEVAKHRIFIRLNSRVLPDKKLIVIARSDDATFGILHSRFHRLWSLRLGATLEDRPCYTPSTCFETFPFPTGFTPRDTAKTAASGPEAEAIAAAARELDEARNAWLNPPEWVDWVITPEEEKAHFPARPVAKPGHEADLKKRTLTNLYNARPAWLDMAHQALDKAVAAAYGWQDYTPEMPDEEILRRLLALNLARS
jgi:type II restriction/modification system DNA methylase subunit YeeA